MKHRFLTLLFIFSAICINTTAANAEYISFRGADGEILAYIGNDGEISNSFGLTTGFFTADGQILDKQGKPAGRFDGGKITDAAGNLLGQYKNGVMIVAGGNSIADYQNSRLYNSKGNLAGETGSEKLAILYVFFRDKFFGD